MQYRRIRIPGATYFFTVVTHNRKKIFNDSKNIDLLKKAISYTKAKHPFDIDALVVMPDHLHCLWTMPPDDDNYPTRWRLIKSYFSKNCGLEKPIWQNRYWEHTIRDEKDMNLHMDYIHFNPVKHKLVNHVKNWKYSTFHYCVALGFYPENWGNQINESWFDSIVSAE